CLRTSSIRGRSPGPNAICCWARSRSSPLRSFSFSLLGIDRAGPILSIRHFGAATNVDLVLGTCLDAEPGRPQHRLGAGAVGDPPVRPVMRIFALDEIHLRPGALPENLALLERII